MRIIAGKYGGRRLLSFKAGHVRPTTDRVKETIFNKLMPYISGARVLDLFAGTGNLGIESLSRGAREVVFVESNEKSLRLIQQNLAHLQITENMQVIKQDVFQFLASYRGDSFDVILIDPPFTQCLADRVMLALSQHKSLFHAETLSVIESVKQEVIHNDYPPLFLVDQKNYGDKKLSFFQAKEPTS